MQFDRIATRSLLALVLSGFSVAACGHRVVVHTAANPAATFDKYATFSFGGAEAPPRGYRLSPDSADVQQRLEAMIAGGLAQRGYQTASGKGDFVVMFGAGRRQIAEHESSDDVGGEWQPNDEDADFVEGALVIDAFDGTSGARVWHGASREQVDPNHVDDDELRRLVAALLAAFPAHGPRTAS